MSSRVVILGLVAAVCFCCSAWGADLKVGYADIVVPDPELAATLTKLRAFLKTGKKSNIRNVESFFARKVNVFQRSLDPFQPWNPTSRIDVHFLDAVADAIVEQGELEAGQPVPDYRVEAMRQMLALIPEGGTFGHMKEVPGEICAPADYKVDRKAALAFAKKFELDAYSLRFYAEPVILRDRPVKSAVPKGEIPAFTLMMFDYDPKAPEGWGLYETSGGTRGYMQEPAETLGLAQHHICFAREHGKYRITSIFGYGL